MPGLNGAVHQLSSWTQLSPDLICAFKDYVKAAIRTDPHDLLLWSRDYFRAMSLGHPPPDKDRWEEPQSRDSRSGITVGLLRVLHKQFKSRQPAQVTLGDVSKQWDAMGLDLQRLDDLLELVASGTQAGSNPIGDETDRTGAEHSGAEDADDAERRDATAKYALRDPGVVVDWSKLLALAAGQLGDSLGETMEKLCTILTEDQQGGSSLPVENFIEMYTYLANIDDDIPKSDIEAVIEYAGKVAQIQNGTINRYNLKSPLCPNLH